MCSLSTFVRKLTLACACVAAFSLNAAEIWVAPDGADTNAGTREQPLATLAQAVRKGRELRRLSGARVDVEGGVHIMLRGGTHILSDVVVLRPEDSGTEGSPTVVAAAQGERPVLSGGIALGPWKKLEGDFAGLPAAARGNVWVAEAPVFRGRVLDFRQLWIGDHKAVRARTPNGDAMERLVAWDRAKQNALIPSALVLALAKGDTSRVEMQLLQQWAIAVLRVRTLNVEGDRARVTFHEPESRLEFEHPWPQPIMAEGNNAPFYLAGAIEFLDEPGEWCVDPASRRVFYWPRADENLATARVVAPALETLVQIVGTVDRPVAHVSIRGIAFAHTTWMRPSEAGHVPLQAGMFMLDAYKLTPKGTPDWRSLDNQDWVRRPPASVEVRGANNVRIERCRFEQMASAGIDFVEATRDDVIEGCVFRDVGGNAIQLGSFQEDPIETHLPFDPADERVICTRDRIANNLITDATSEDWGCVGIAVGYAREVTIEHNDIGHLSYTGISLGWGWTRTTNCMRNNRVRANRIHHIAQRLADTGGIYTLSAQPGTIVSENAIESIVVGPWAHDRNHWSYIYLDEGSSFITVRDNWCPEEKFQKNANGPGNTWERNGPTVPREIADAAGLEPAFRDLLSK